ncbi:uncharacterized protein PSANT_07055 [Moesziomyces antarcticus]|uniref:Uncharacterized protein n=1 Tax=Pseudozyma antarctica TaxID=84753 RepID=A0A5C3FYP8_PSEA2|nr:uncharacterized protein PSANT_07055 [Moesziomyces antarcticus]
MRSPNVVLGKLSLLSTGKRERWRQGFREIEPFQRHVHRLAWNDERRVCTIGWVDASAPPARTSILRQPIIGYRHKMLYRAPWDGTKMTPCQRELQLPCPTAC